MGETTDVPGEALALRTWDGDGAVRLLEYDEPSGSMLLERLDAATPLASVQNGMDALQIISELLARLSSVAAPPGLRRLSDLGNRLLERTHAALSRPIGDAQRAVLVGCTAALRDVLPEPGDRLLHIDLHFDNVLAPLPGNPREPWLAIDPNPLAGDPGFALLAALHNRWDEAIATGDVPRAVRRRFDVMTEVLDLDRKRAQAWTLARILETVLWDVENDDTQWNTGPDMAIAITLLE
jgi:streptomycin 6-kinase